MKKNFGIKIGETYRLKSSPTYSYVKVVAIDEKKTPKLAKCEHTVYKGDLVGFIRWFKLSDLKKE